MAKELPPGFDRASVLAGLRKAMEFGQPTRAADQATFYKVTTVTGTGVEPHDEDFIPFNPDVNRSVRPTSIVVPCAVEFVDRADQVETFGAVTSTRVKLTLLDEDYQRVKGFSYVAIGGDKYLYRLTEPPIALGSIDVWTVHVVAEDEG